MPNPTPEQLVTLLDRRRDRVQRQLDRRLTIKLWTYQAIALVVVVGTIVLGLAIDSAHGAAQRPASCVVATDVPRIHDGLSQRRVERLRTGPGQLVLQDQLLYGVSYPSCDTAMVLVVLYSRTSHRVLEVIYTAA